VTLGYAVAVPVAVFPALAWAVHAPLLSRPAVRPAAVLGGGAAVLRIPLAASTLSLAAPVAAMAAVCAAVVASKAR
jgi:hypothetical protein